MNQTVVLRINASGEEFFQSRAILREILGYNPKLHYFQKKIFVVLNSQKILFKK